MAVREKLTKILYEKLVDLDQYSTNYWEVVSIITVLALIGDFNNHKSNINKELIQAGIAFTNALRHRYDIRREIASRLQCEDSDVDSGTLMRVFNTLLKQMDISETFEAWKVLCYEKLVELRGQIRKNIYELDNRLNNIENELRNLEYKESNSWWNIVQQKKVIKENEEIADREEKLTKEYYKGVITVNLMIGAYISIYNDFDLRQSKYANERLIKEGVALAEAYLKVTLMDRIDRNNKLILLYCSDVIGRLYSFVNEKLTEHELEEAAHNAFCNCVLNSDSIKIIKEDRIEARRLAFEWMNNDVLGETQSYKDIGYWRVG